MKTLKAIFASIFFLIPIAAFAGERLDYTITIDLENREAAGGMFAARSSDDINQMIGCGRSVGEYDAPYDNYGYCQATDADGVFVGCVFFDPEYFDVISSINAYSYVKFGFDGGPDEFSNCTYLVVTAKSSYLPFTPVVKEKVK